VFRVKVCQDGGGGGDASCNKVFPASNPISPGTSRGLWEWCGPQGFRLAMGIFRSSRSFIGSSFFFFVSETNVVFLTRSMTSHLQPTMSGQHKVEQQRRRCRHGLEVEVEGLLKDLVVIIVF
jgi:hypothetical protein